MGFVQLMDSVPRGLFWWTHYVTECASLWENEWVVCFSLDRTGYLYDRLLMIVAATV